MPLGVVESRLSKDIVLAKIPAFPPIILRVLDLLSRERPDMVPLVREISSDAALSAQVLRIANSPLFGLAAQVDTVPRAVMTLGFDRVRALVMTVAANNYMKAALQTPALPKCWRHTLASAILCRELAQAANLPPDEAYTLGLLHDIGRLGLLAAYPEEYNGIFEAADREAVPLLNLEKKHFGVDHCEAGRLMMEQWNLPAEFCTIAGRHHDSPSGASLDFLTIVHVACRLAETLGYSVAIPLKYVPFDQIRGQLPTSVRARFADDPRVLQERIEEALSQSQFMAEASAPADIRSRINQPVPGALPSDSPRLFAPLPNDPAAWDPSVLLLAVMVLLVLLAGASCLWNG